MHWVTYRVEVWNTYSEVATSDLQWNAALDQLSHVQSKAHLCNHVVWSACQYAALVRWIDCHGKGSEVLTNKVFNKFVPKEMGAETERTESAVFILNQ